MSATIGEMSVYAQIGEAGFTDLVRRFYARVRGDALISPMYPTGDWEGSERRLRLFLIQRFGGPQTYSEERGHPMLRGRHVGFPIDKTAAGRWLSLMKEALAESIAAGTVTPQAAEVLWPFFEGGAEYMINRQAASGGGEGAAG